MLQITSSGSSSEVPVDTQASVLVYRTTTGQRNRSRMASTISGGTRAAPELTMRNDETSVVARSGWASIICHCAGTPWPTVTRSRSMSCSAPAAVQGVGQMIVVMTCISSSHTRVM